MLPDDKELIEKYLDGDDSAFSELLDLYLKPTYNFLYRFTGNAAATDDLTQETFIKVWKNLKRFDRGKKFKTWLFTIAKNTAFDYLKKKKTIPFSSFTGEEDNNYLENISEDSALPDELLEKKDLAEELDGKLKQLPKQYELILVMRYKDDFSLAEIAEILELPYNTVKSQHARALAGLKKILEDGKP
ncbi:MAG: sigma-70 family RNA polymerase sigma factor [Candidatus Pacebacteria bacterium]|nr:sigma-70 family RNA polymerase sigma factor [Candidatus Paceibacterota bacterium]MDR3583194.1 sigma-70 family RNA polymerase sigma factor [Candidatus Paceibacterota bacterium]